MITPTLFRKKPHLASTSSSLNSSEKLPTKWWSRFFLKCRATRISPITHSAWHRHGASGKRTGAMVWFFLRSEERRVGKECRSRGSRYHKKKKKERQCN